MILDGGAVAVCGLLVCRRRERRSSRAPQSSSLGPGLPSWSHIKEQPCLSTCAGWSLSSAFPAAGVVAHISDASTHTQNVKGGEMGLYSAGCGEDKRDKGDGIKNSGVFMQAFLLFCVFAFLMNSSEASRTSSVLCD